MTNLYNHYRPIQLPLFGSQRFIAPYWADVDLRGTGEVYYRQTNDPVLLARATNEIQTAFPMSQDVDITHLFIVTWDAVGYYFRHIDKVRYLRMYLLFINHAYIHTYVCENICSYVRSCIKQMVCMYIRMCIYVTGFRKINSIVEFTEEIPI